MTDKVESKTVRRFKLSNPYPSLTFFKEGTFPLIITEEDCDKNYLHLNMNLLKVPAKALHGLRDSLRGDVVITMSKKKLIRRAFINSGKEHLVELADQIQGITALLFTNMNPIKLAQFLESKAVKGPAKPGDIAPVEIVVKAGDTKIAPGPIISELNQNLKTQ